MDAAAVAAMQELPADLTTWTALQLAQWWARHFPQAGHKRLGRLLAKLGKTDG